MELATQKLVREFNAMTILNVIRENEPISRADIVKITKLAFPTVMRIVDMLINGNLVIETVPAESTVGRRPMLLCMNKDAFYVIGAVIHSNIDIWMLDMQSNVLSKWSELVHPGKDTAEDQLARTAEMINMLIASCGIEKERIAAVSIAHPGTDFLANPRIQTTQFAGWQKPHHIKPLMEEAIGLPVRVENISRAFTYGEIYHGLGRHYKDFLLVRVDSGVSGCNVINSKILEGKHGVSGEFGHTSIDPINGRLCYCGNRGCIESYISKWGIVETLQERLDSTSPLYQALRGSLSLLTFEKAAEATQYDPVVAEVFREAGRLFGHTLVNFVNMLDPNAIILCGDVVTASNDFVKEAERVMRASIFSNKARKVKLLVSPIRDSQRLLGTATAAILDTLAGYLHRENKKKANASD
ncbi:MAG: ROK family protein [Clostridiales bacterium]|nr:ROK family protein [Clostridiales bacterium]